MKQRKLGTNGPLVSALGYGAMGLSGMYGPADDAQSEAVLRRALDRGVTFFDTADFYGSGHNELLLGRVLRERREHVVISDKFGVLRTPDGGWGGVDCRPAAIRNWLAYSLKRLGTDYLDLYTPARLDKSVPLEEMWGALAQLVRRGFVKHIGLSEVGPDDLRRAHAIHPVAALQIEYSLFTRDIEAEIVPVCRELGIAIVAYSPLSRGFLTGDLRSPQQLDARDYRKHSPRFLGDAFVANAALAERVRTAADAHGCTPAQLALAWVLAQGDDVIPIPGTRTPARLDENLGALDVVLSADRARAIADALPADAVTGARYDKTSIQLVYQAASRIS